MDRPQSPDSDEARDAELAFAADVAMREAFARNNTSPSEWLHHITSEDRAAALASLCGVEGTQAVHEHVMGMVEGDFGIFVGGSIQEPKVYKVKAVAIEYLQFQALFGWYEWALETLPSPEPIPVHELLSRRDEALDSLAPQERLDLIDRAEYEVLTHARHRGGEGEVEIAHRLLQLLGRLPEERQPVCPHTLLTPIMETFHLSNLESERPRPHLRVASARRENFLLGYVVMDDGGPVLDFASSPVARLAESDVTRCFDRGGAGLVMADGSALPIDTTPAQELLRALADRLEEYRTEVVI